MFFTLTIVRRECAAEDAPIFCEAIEAVNAGKLAATFPLFRLKNNCNAF